MVVKGAALFRQHRFEEARQAFAAAYQQTPKAPTLLNLALAEVQSEHFVEALVHLRAYASATDAEPAKVANVRERLVPLAESKTAHLIIVDAPPDTQLTLDGSASTPVDANGVDVTVGHHAIELVLGAQRQSYQVDLVGGEKKWLSAASLTAPSKEASESAMAVPWVELTPSPPPAPQHHGVPTHDWVALGLGVASLASLSIAGVSYLQGRSADDHASSLRQAIGTASSCSSAPVAATTQATCADLATSASEATSDNNRATGFAIAGGVLALAAVSTWLLWPAPHDDAAAANHDEGSKRAFGFVPQVGATGAGLDVFGAF